MILTTPGLGLAQMAEVTLERREARVGVDGLSRAGEWTPLRVRLTNQTSDYREVVLRWPLPDADGDIARYERPVALSPLATMDVWTYGVLPGAAQSSATYPLRVIDNPSGALLDATRVSPDAMAAPDQPVIGVLSGSKLGLSFVEQPAPRHEAVRLHTGLELRRLPDRWQGLGLFQALIWTTQGGLPTAGGVSGDTLEALERWIERGGHFVLMWPATGREWFDTPIGDLLPFSRDGILRVNGGAPAWLGRIPPQRSAEIPYHTFRIDPRRGGSVLLTDNDDRRSSAGRPVVVTRRHGRGRITVIGIDWSQPALRAMGVPNGRTTPWHDVFGWNAPAMTDGYIRSEIDSGSMVNPNNRPPPRDVSDVLARRTAGAMREAAGPVLLGAVVLFVLYWLIAGPILDSALGKRGLARHRWPVFTAVALAFTGICWGGAYLVRPATLRVSHFTVLDVDVAKGRTWARSNVTAFVPRFGRAELAIAPGREAGVNDNLLNFAANPLATTSGGFPDTQTYTVNAARPASANVPVRSTTKSLTSRFAGPLLAPSVVEAEPYGVEWSVPRGELTLSESRWPQGELQHNLPAPLREVKVIYCPGDGQTPWIWGITDAWHPGSVLRVEEPRRADRLVRKPPNGIYTASRTLNREGYLGKLLATRIGGMPTLGVAPRAAAMSDGRVIEQVEMLSFFDLLPPPNFRDTDDYRGVGVVRRPRGRSLDLSHLTATRCVIVMGHLPDSPLPLPLTVGDREPPARGWTTVRCVFELQERGSDANVATRGNRR